MKKFLKKYAFFVFTYFIFICSTKLLFLKSFAMQINLPAQKISENIQISESISESIINKLIENNINKNNKIQTKTNSDNNHAKTNQDNKIKLPNIHKKPVIFKSKKIKDSSFNNTSFNNTSLNKNIYSNKNTSLNKNTKTNKTKKLKKTLALNINIKNNLESKNFKKQTKEFLKSNKSKTNPEGHGSNTHFMPKIYLKPDIMAKHSSLDSTDSIESEDDYEADKIIFNNLELLEGNENYQKSINKIFNGKLPFSPQSPDKETCLNEEPPEIIIQGFSFTSDPENIESIQSSKESSKKSSPDFFERNNSYSNTDENSLNQDQESLDQDQDSLNSDQDIESPTTKTFEEIQYIKRPICYEEDEEEY